jgi:hypothetical protein
MHVIKIVFLLCVFCLFVPAAFADSVYAGLVSPYVDRNRTVLLSGVGYADDSFIGACRFDLHSVYDGIDSDSSLTGVTLAPEPARFDILAFQFPQISSGDGIFSLKPFIVPFLSAGATISFRDFTFGAAAQALFVPELSTDVESQSVCLHSASMPGATLSAGYRGVTISFSCLVGKTWIDVEDAVVGDVSASAMLASVSTRNAGLFFLSVESSLSVSAYALLFDNVGFAATMDGSALIRGAGGWLGGDFSRGKFSLNWFCAAAALWTRDTGLSARYRLNADPEKSVSYRLNLDPAICALGHVSAGYSFSRRLTLYAGRWFWYQSKSLMPVRESNRTGTTSPAVSKEDNKDGFRLDTIDWRTLIFSGAEISLKIVF